MPIHSEKSLYPGINIHLNSLLQNEPGGGSNFHAEFIIYLREHLDRVLPPGYFSRSEKSLQIEGFDPASGKEQLTPLRPDISLYRVPGWTFAEPAPLETTPPTAIIPIADTLTEEETLTGLVIYQAGEGGTLGRPITRIEVLSPTNKPGGSYHIPYLIKRGDTLKSGLRLVEIDFLHETPPVIPVLPDYSKGESGAQPFTILISDPRPTLEQGHTTIYSFGVDNALPIVDIPLAGADHLPVDFGLVYHHMYENVRFFRMVIDYSQDVPHFGRYTEADREKIQARLAVIRQQHGG
ncbi:MAG: DUF4058 family protein [Chloroflexi bacterium]|nr:DUF4058 family protein [Chloroflexota bacterium]